MRTNPPAGSRGPGRDPHTGRRDLYLPPHQESGSDLASTGRLLRRRQRASGTSSLPPGPHQVAISQHSNLPGAKLVSPEFP